MTQFVELANLAGYCGAALVAVAYFLNQRGRLRSEDWRFPGMNLLGSLLIMASLLFEPNAPSVVIECFWSAISVYGVVRNVRRARARHANPAIVPDPPGR